MFFQKLYVRIWAAVVLAVAVLTFLVGVAWRMNAEPPLREVVVRNPQGDVIGRGSARRMHPPPFGPPGGLQDAQGGHCGAVAVIDIHHAEPRGTAGKHAH